MGSGIDRYYDGEYDLTTKKISTKDNLSFYEEMDMAGGEEEYVKSMKEELFPKQGRYKSLDGKLDYIDECAANYTPEEFRGAMKFTIGKYQSRLGKKDNIVQEVTKIADYANRWLQYEIKLENNKEK